MGKLREGHVSFLHILVHITDGGGDASLLSFEARPLEESSPVAFETADVSVGLNWEVLENLPLLELPEEGAGHDTLVDSIELGELVEEFIVEEFVEDAPGDHPEGKGGDELLSSDSQLVVLFVPDDMGETR